jgi:hypothetical protein
MLAAPASERTSAARTRKLACALPAAPVSGCAPCLVAAAAAAWHWQCCLRLQRCCRCCPLRSCADGGASVGGAGGVCICFIGKSDLVVQPEHFARNAFCKRHVEHDDRSDRLDVRVRDADSGSSTAGASRGVSPGPPRSRPWADPSVSKRNCISCQPGAGAVAQRV